jgi:hypothetical protein
MASKLMTADEIIKRTDAAFEEMDFVRLEELSENMELFAIKNELLAGEMGRLEEKYGKAFPEVKSIKSKLALNNEVAKALEIEVEHSKAKQPEVDVSGWRVIGTVSSKADKPVASMTIFLIDEKNQLVSKLPSSVTDENGNYSIILTKEHLREELKNKKLFLGSSIGEKLYPLTDIPIVVAAGEFQYLDIMLETKPNWPLDE